MDRKLGWHLVKITPPYTRKGNYISGNTQFYRNDEDLPKDLVDWSITSIKRPGVRLRPYCGSAPGVEAFTSYKKQKTRPEIIYEHFTNYTLKDGLSNYNIWGIEEDADGNLWISTENGLSKFDPVTKVFVNYNEKDGLPNGHVWLVITLYKPGRKTLFCSWMVYCLFIPIVYTATPLFLRFI